MAFNGKNEAASKLICADSVKIIIVAVSPGIFFAILIAVEYIHRNDGVLVG